MYKMIKFFAIAVIGMMCVSTIFAETNVLQQGSTVGFKINVDRSGTIQNAFTVALSAAGFKNVSTHSDYNLNVNVTITPLTIPNNRMAFVQFELNANLLDNNGRVLLPYSFSFRKEHNDKTLAEIRAFNDAVSKINAEYRNLLNDIIAAEPIQPIKQGSTVGFRINDDRNGIIQKAFTTILSSAGLSNGDNNSDYNLDLTITITPLALQNNANVFVQFELFANLFDNSGRVLLPYTISWRDGHRNQTGAENRAFREAVTKINAEYRELLNGILQGEW
jgi:hypothetical protein